jgi:hypothetical protein
MDKMVRFLSGPRAVRFFMLLFAALAALSGALAVLAATVVWMKPVLGIALANLVLTTAMAVMNSILLDRMRGK